MPDEEMIDDLSLEELKKEAKEKGIKNYSSMTKAELKDILLKDEESKK